MSIKNLFNNDKKSKIVSTNTCRDRDWETNMYYKMKI